MRPEERRREWIRAGVLLLLIVLMFCAHKVLPPLPENADALFQQKQVASAHATTAACAIVQKTRADLIAEGLKRQAEKLNVQAICSPGTLDKGDVVDLLAVGLIMAFFGAAIASMRFA